MKSISREKLIFFRNSDESLIKQFSETYLTKSKHQINFLAVNWLKGSTTVNYFSARNRVKSVAEHLAKLINLMTNKYMLKLDTFTIVGHSLGAHIAGIGMFYYFIYSHVSFNKYRLPVFFSL